MSSFKSKKIDRKEYNIVQTEIANWFGSVTFEYNTPSWY